MGAFLITILIFNEINIDEVSRKIGSKVHPETSKQRNNIQYVDRKEIKKTMIQYLQELPRLPKPPKKSQFDRFDLVIYNRVAKCGSTTTKLMLDVLSSRKTFQFKEYHTDHANNHSH